METSAGSLARTLSDGSTLELLLESIWTNLECVTDCATLPWGVPVLSNIGPHGPEARSVVLRHVDRNARTLTAFTDARSPKVAQLETDPQAVWTFYDPTERIQLIAKTHVQVLRQGDFADHCWNTSRPESLQCYLGTQPPGTTLPGPPPASSGPLELQELAGGRENFTVLLGQVIKFDWLALSRTGNRRAQFLWDNNQSESHWQADWLMP